jgi:hypothetical protein
MHLSVVEWYRGKVLYVHGHEATIDVVYEDGELGNGLLRKCVRPFKPYHVGELIEVLVNDLGFVTGRIVKVDPGELYDIATDSAGVQRNKSTVDIRREFKVEVKVGTLVDARFQGGDEWFPGEIMEVSHDGSYTVRFDDGDLEDGVDLENIRT